MNAKRSTTRKARQPGNSGLTAFLYQHSFILFALFLVFALWAFWTSYYGHFFKPHPASVRFHGLTMTLWCVMLIAQAWLIRRKKFKWHRLFGNASYLVVPLILVSGFILSKETITRSPAGSPPYYFSIALMYNALIVFAILYGLAIFFRKRPDRHARFMASTIFPLFTPVTDRLIYKYFDFLVPLAPRMTTGAPMVPGLGFLLADILVIGLLIWDWRKHKRLDVFPLVLGILLLYHLSVLTFYKFGFWQTWGNWIMQF